MDTNLFNKIKKLPHQPGIYLFYNVQKELIYVGKATTLKNRVGSYFSGTPKSIRPIEDMIGEVTDIKWVVTDSVLEAIILEANYIKKYQPKYNVDGKDDKSWNYLVITNDEYPRLKAVRQHEIDKNKNIKIQEYKNNLKLIFGPFPGIKTKEMMKILQKIFSISTCKPNQGKPCLYRQMNQCLGVCTGEIKAQEYIKKVIQPLVKFLKGNKKSLIRDLAKQMKVNSKEQEFEEAGRLRDQIKNLKKIQDVALLNKEFFNKKIKNLKLKIKNFRIEGYDISNLGESGKVGSMVVFNQSGPVKSEYRRFKIKTVIGQSDVDCLEEVLARRLKRKDWLWPDIILVDGGKPQVNVVIKEIKKQGYNIPVIGIAKGAGRKKNEFIYYETNKRLGEFVKNNQELLIQVRDEAHRFAIQYQRKLRKIKI